MRLIGRRFGDQNSALLGFGMIIGSIPWLYLDISRGAPGMVEFCSRRNTIKDLIRGRNLTIRWAAFLWVFLSMKPFLHVRAD